MGIFIVILLIIGFVIMFVRDNYKLNAEEEKRAEWRKKCGIEVIDTFSVKYYGGFNDIGIVNGCAIEVMKDKIKLTFRKDGDNGFLKTKYIIYSNIKEVSVQTTVDIKEKVSLGKIICFGVLAFGMKGNTQEVMNEMLVITINDNGSKSSLLFGCNDIEAVRQSICVERNNYKQRMGSSS